MHVYTNQLLVIFIAQNHEILSLKRYHRFVAMKYNYSTLIQGESRVANIQIII